jgi:hypothetical protein
MPAQYIVTHVERGIIVRGTITISEIVALCEAWKEEYGYDVADMELARHMGAALVVSKDQETVKQWRKEMGYTAPEETSDDEP